MLSSSRRPQIAGIPIFLLGMSTKLMDEDRIRMVIILIFGTKEENEDLRHQRQGFPVIVR